MRVLKVGMGGIAVLLAALTALAVVTAPGRAADPEKKDETPQKKYQFAMDGKPWSAVFKWLTDETGKEVINTTGPTGTFSFTGPENKSYTLPDVIDLINAGLLANSPTAKFCLINGDHQFFVVPADQKIDPILVPHIERPGGLEGPRRHGIRPDGAAADLAERGGHGPPDRADHGAVPRRWSPCPATSSTCWTTSATSSTWCRR